MSVILDSTEVASISSSANQPQTEPLVALLNILDNAEPAQPEDEADIDIFNMDSSTSVSGTALSNTHGTAVSPIVLDSEPELEDEYTIISGSLASPISVSSSVSSRAPSIFDTPPHSAISTATTDSFIPEITKEVIDLTRDESQSKGKERAVEPIIINVEELPSIEPQFFDDAMDITMQESSSDPTNPIDLLDIDIPDFSDTPLLEQYLELMMSSMEANRLIQEAHWKPVEQTSPISRLPTEILCMIFDYALPSFAKSLLDDPNYYQDRLRDGIPIMKVCRRWRYMLLPKVLRSVTVSECTFLTKSAHCQSCQLNRYLVSVPVVRSLFDGTATVEMMQMADCIRTVALSPQNCDRRSKTGEDSLESGFVYFLPKVESVVLPSNLVKNFLNGSSAHGLNLNPKTLPNIRVYNPAPTTPRRRIAFSDFLEVGDVASSWIIPEDVKKLDIDGDCLRMCSRIPMCLLEEVTIDRRPHWDKFVQTPPASALCQFLSIYSTEFSTLSKVTLRWLPKPDPSFPLIAGVNNQQDPCLCSLLGSIPSLEHLDLSSICPLLFAKKVGKPIAHVTFEYPCVLNRTRPPPPTKFNNLRALISPANEMRNRLIPAGVEHSRVPTVISLLSIKARDMPHLVEPSLTAPPSYALDLAKKVVRVTEYSAKAAARYRIYINGLVQRSTHAILGRENRQLLSEYAIAAKTKALTDGWHCGWKGPPASKKQRTTVLRWDYDVDLDIFLSGAASGEFMTLGRQKDRVLNAREAEERKARKLEMEKLKSAAVPKKRVRKRKAEAVVETQPAIETKTHPKKKPNLDPGITLPPIASLVPSVASISTSGINTFTPTTVATSSSTTIHPSMVQILWA